MYVIGVSECDFINVKSKMMMDCTNFWDEIVKVEYECDLKKATFFQNYESVVKTLNEIQERKGKIRFQNESIIGDILDRGKEFDVGKLKVYRLVPQLCE